MEMESRAESSNIAIARLTAIQAIVVALITAGAGVATVYLAGGTLSASADVVQRWITIENIESDDHKLIRLVIQVNGVNYSYPSNTVWAEIGLGKSQERFPLPISDSTYLVSFRAILSDPGNVSTYMAVSQEIQNHSVGKLPADNKAYKMYPHSESGLITVANSTLQVNYSIE
jgi:hypothetical protein